MLGGWWIVMRGLDGGLEERGGGGKCLIALDFGEGGLYEYLSTSSDYYYFWRALLGDADLEGLIDRA